MKEKEVEAIVDSYLRSEKSGMVFIRNNFGVDIQQVGIVVKDGSISLRSQMKTMQIECKGSNSKIDRAIGQCLRYKYVNRSVGHM